MWKNKSDNEEALLIDAIEFTSDHKKYGEAMREVVYKWNNTVKNHLTNKSINRKAFIGHCAVFYKIQIPEYIVRMAWKHLTDNQRLLANLEAEQTIKEWELWYMKELDSTLKHGNEDAIKMGFQMKLQLN